MYYLSNAAGSYACNVSICVWRKDLYPVRYKDAGAANFIYLIKPKFIF